MSNFLDTLEEFLEDSSITKLNFSKKVNIPSSTIYNLKSDNPSMLTALKIVDYFSSSLDYFERKINDSKCQFDKNYKITFYQNLTKEMKTQQITQKTLCNETNIGETAFRRWKKGKMPSYENLVTLSTFLNVSMDELLGRKYKIIR